MIESAVDSVFGVTFEIDIRKGFPECKLCLIHPKEVWSCASYVPDVKNKTTGAIRMYSSASPDISRTVSVLCATIVCRAGLLKLCSCYVESVLTCA